MNARAVAAFFIRQVTHKDQACVNRESAEFFAVFHKKESPVFVQWHRSCPRGYMGGKINTDDPITRAMPPQDINKASDLMCNGESIHSVVVY